MKRLLPMIAAVCLATSANASEREIEVIRAQLHEIAWMSAEDRPIPEMTAEYMNYFAAEPTLLPPNQEAVVGREAIEDFYNRAFGGIRLISNQYFDEEIVVNGDMASRHYVGIAHLSFPGDPDDMTEIMSINRYMDVLVKEDGEWRMVWHSWVPVTWDLDDSAALKEDSKSMSVRVPSFEFDGDVCERQ